jgi:hypothetical protein
VAEAQLLEFQLGGWSRLGRPKRKRGRLIRNWGQEMILHELLRIR